MNPVIVLQEVIDPQRQSGDVEEVSHWQVDQVDAEFIVLANLGRKLIYLVWNWITFSTLLPSHQNRIITKKVNKNN